MTELVAPVSAEPVRPTRKYCVRIKQGHTVTTLQAKTINRFGKDNVTVTENVKVIGNIEWKMELDKFVLLKKKHTRDTEAWTENSARVYNLVLQHCPLDLEAELQNYSSWAAGQSAQNFIALFVMIRDVTHNMKEAKQRTIVLVECAVKLFTTAQKPSKSINDYYKIFTAQKDTLNAHGRQAGRHKMVYAEA